MYHTGILLLNGQLQLRVGADRVLVLLNFWSRKWERNDGYLEANISF